MSPFLRASYSVEFDSVTRTSAPWPQRTQPSPREGRRSRALQDTRNGGGNVAGWAGG